ncbi:MAG: BMP family ABC transporter substrate-binding protein [Actinobacteria bacterium]|nr:BMP family ABC transporter substrate-binding protein [Actinomycetota bacterium]
MALVVLTVMAPACRPGTEPRPGQTPTDTTPFTPSPPARGLTVGIVLAPPTELIASLQSDIVRSTAERLHDVIDHDVRAVRVLEPPQEDFRGDQLAFLADEGFTLVCTVGQAGADDVARLAPQYPATRFCLLDGRLADPPANAMSVSWRVEEGAFLAGAAGALVTSVGATGIVSAVPPGSADRVRIGFEAGARFIRSDIPVVMAPATVDQDVAMSVAVRTAREAATAQFDAGVPTPCLMPVGGTAVVRGVGEAAAASDGLVLGWAVDVTRLLDEDTGVAHVLGSVTKRFDTALALVVESAFEGGDRDIRLGFAEDGFAFVPGPSPSYGPIAAQLREVADAIEERRVIVPGREQR